MIVDIFWTSIDILQYMDMAILSIYENCFFLIRNMGIYLIFVFADFFPIRFKLFALLPRLFIADYEFGKYDIYKVSSVS